MYCLQFLYFCRPFLKRICQLERMMRRFVIYFCISLLLVGCHRHKASITIVPDFAKTHLQREHLYGNVRTVVDSMFYSPHGSDSVSADRLVSVTVYRYSADGWLNQVLKMSANGDTMSNRLMHYDDNAKLVKDELFDSTRSCIEYTIYENDERGLRVKEEHFAGDALLQTILYQNDAFGNLIEMTVRNAEYTLTRKYTNNELGLVVRVDEFDPDGKLFKYVTMDYDNYGDIVNRNVHRDDGQIREFTHTQYADNGALLKTIYENKLSQGNEVREFSNHDNQRNWTRSVRKNAGRIFFIIKREIEYY